MPSNPLKELVLIATLLASIAPLAIGASGGGVADLAPAPDRIVTIDVPDPEVVQMVVGGSLWNAVSFDGAVSLPTPGAPALPSISNPLSLGEKVSSLTLERSDPVIVPLSAPIVPSTGPVRIGAPASEVEVRPYDTAASYPADPFSYAYIGSTWEDGKEVHRYSVAACPFDYDPSTGELTMYRTMAIGIEDGPVVMPMDTGARAVAAPSTLREGTVLLIISADTLVDDMEPYRQWSMEKGQIATLVKFSTVDDAYSTLDGPSSIWQYIHDSYFAAGSRLKYVLLVGEVGMVPSRMVKDLNPFTGEPATLPADTYYACMGSATSGPTLWNTDGDANWGEQGDITDMLADVYVSRIAVSSDTAAAGWCRKVIDYELRPAMSGWGGKAGMFGSETHYANDGEIQSNYLWNNYLSDVYSVKSPYYTHGGASGTFPDLTYSNIRAGLDDGLSLVVYMGHGLSYLWTSGMQDVAVPIFDTDTASSIGQGTRVPFVTAMSCETNWFDYPGYESISEGFTENPGGGAIAYVGASRTTYGGIGYGYYPGAPGVQEDICRMISSAQPRYRTAEVFAEAKNYYVNSFGAYFGGDPENAFNAWMEHNLLGPPDTPIWTAEPKSMTVTFSFDPDYYTNFTVDVKGTGGVALSGAAVTVYSLERDRASTGTTDSYGNAKVPFVIDGPQNGLLTVTMKGYKPFQTSIVMQDTTVPATTLKTRTTKPDGDNGWFVGDPQLTLSASESSTIYYKWNGGGRATYKGGEIQVPVGRNTLTYWAEDLSGNIEPTRTFKIDYDPDAPVMGYSVAPKAPDGNSGYYIHRPVITVTLEVSSGSPQYSEYWWDSGSKAACNGTIYAMEGDHVLHIRAYDEAGNIGESVDIPLKVDSIAPKVTFFTGGVTQNELGWYTEPFTITLKCNDQSGTIYYRWDGGVWTKYGSAITPMEGEHVLEHYATDPSGNTGETVTRDIRFDVTAPTVTISSSPKEPDGDAGYYVTKPTVTLASSEAGSTIMYNLDRAGFRAFEAPIKLMDGEHSIEAYAIDLAGNTGERRSMELNVDSLPDKVEYSVQPGPTTTGWYDAKPSIRLTSNSGTSIFYSWEGISAFSKYNGNLLPPVEEGVVYLVFYSVDQAGNRGGQSRLSFSVDTNAPTAVLNVTTGAPPGEVSAFDLSGSHDGIGVTGYWIDFGDGTDPQWYTTPVIDHIYQKAGNYNVKAKVRDQAGHESSIVQRTVGVQDGGSGLVLIAIVAGAAVLVLVVVVLGLVLLKHRTEQQPHHVIVHRPMAHPHPHHAGHQTHQLPTHHPAMPRAPPPVRMAPHAGHPPAHHAARPGQMPHPQSPVPAPPRPPVAPTVQATYRVPEPPKPPTSQQ